jgi:hypothetical protein
MAEIRKLKKQGLGVRVIARELKTGSKLRVQGAQAENVRPLALLGGQIPVLVTWRSPDCAAGAVFCGTTSN